MIVSLLVVQQNLMEAWLCPDSLRELINQESLLLLTQWYLQDWGGRFTISPHSESG